MNGIIFELEEKSKYTGRYMDGEISYNNTSIDYTKEIRECDRKSEIKDLLNDPCLGKIFEKGEVDDEIIYNGNIEDVKEEWMRAIQNGVDKMNVNKDMNGHNLIYVIKYGICRYAYRICIDSYPGYVVKDPITLIEWVQGLKPGTVIKIRGIFIYHFFITYFMKTQEEYALEIDDDSREESGSGTYYERECDALFDIDGRGNTERLVTRNPKLRNLLEDGEYIPSLGQLNLMAHYMDELNKAFTYVSASPLSSTWYWSSTESSQAVAWYVVFSSGLTGTGNKHIGDMVRTVIDF